MLSSIVGKILKTNIPHFKMRDVRQLYNYMISKFKYGEE